MLSNEKVDTPWTVGGRRPGRDPSYHGVEAKAEGGVGGGQEGGPHGLSKKEARRLRREQRKKEVCHVCGCAWWWEWLMCIGVELSGGHSCD